MTWRGGNGLRCLLLAAMTLTLCGMQLSASPASEARDKAQTVMHRYKAAHPDCEVCGAKGGILKPLDVHHVVPVSVAPDMATDTNNLITVCRNCHLWVCHAGNYRLYVGNLREWLSKREVVR